MDQERAERGDKTEARASRLIHNRPRYISAWALTNSFRTGVSIRPLEDL